MKEVLIQVKDQLAVECLENDKLRAEVVAQGRMINEMKVK